VWCTNTSIVNIVHNNAPNARGVESGGDFIGVRKTKSQKKIEKGVDFQDTIEQKKKKKGPAVKERRVGSDGRKRGERAPD